MSLKTIFGHDISYERALELANIDTLGTRREKAFEKFCLKLEKSDLYQDWLPKQSVVHYDLRKELIYEEKFARTERLYKSPLFCIRRKLNEISLPQFEESAATLNSI